MLALGEWRIATDLVATRDLPRIVTPPVCGRRCPWCRNWTLACAQALPVFLLEQLGRIGVDPPRPTDLYKFEDPDRVSGLIAHRVTFHAVGKILSGPALWIDLELGPHRSYVRPPGAPEGLGLSLGSARQVPDKHSWEREVKGPLIEIDFRLPVPWVLTEPVPQR
jgi:hypothetical protein